jgi:hypothetical protein
VLQVALDAVIDASKSALQAQITSLLKASYTGECFVYHPVAMILI